jgi:Xaa-Pro aminopeptidase
VSISQQEYKRRYHAIQGQMKKDDLDCLLIVGLPDDFNRGNIRYITGAGRGGCCIFPLEGSPLFFTATNVFSNKKLNKTADAVDLLEIRETDNLIEQVTIELTRFHKGNKIGIVGMNCIQVAMFQSVSERFPYKILNTNMYLEPFRAIKSTEEIDKIRTAAAIADSVYTMLRETIKPGLIDYEIYGNVKKIIYGEGCDYSFDLIDASDSTMNMTFSPVGDKLEKNGTLFMEISPSFSGYYAQLPVTLPVVNYSPQVLKMVKAWTQADKAARTILRPGTKLTDLNNILVNTIKENGFISPLRPGHSIGLDILDFWSVTDTTDKVLQPGMTIAIHPSCMLKPGEEAVGMGYTYLITDTGYEQFSKINLAADLVGE